MSSNLYEEIVEANTLYDEIDEIVGRIIKYGVKFRDLTQAGYTQEILAVVDAHRPRTAPDNCHYCSGDQKPETD